MPPKFDRRKVRFGKIHSLRFLLRITITPFLRSELGSLIMQRAIWKPKPMQENTYYQDRWTWYVYPSRFQALSFEVSRFAWNFDIDSHRHTSIPPEAHAFLRSRAKHNCGSSTWLRNTVSPCKDGEEPGGKAS